MFPLDSRNRLIVWFIATVVCSTIVLFALMTLLIGGKAERTPQYFHLMEAGTKMEAQSKLPEAVTYYRQALAASHEVDSGLRREARIAAHNRIGACFRKGGQFDAAIKSFQESIRLGDKQFAPKAIEKTKELAKRAHGKSA